MTSVVSGRARGLSIILLLAVAGPVEAASHLFKNVGPVGHYLTYDNAKPTIADNGSVAYLNIVDFVTDERITVVPAFGDAVVLLDSDDNVRPLNVVGPGISDDGKYVAYMARQTVSGGFPIDRIYRQDATGGPLTLIVEPGDTAQGPIPATIGAASCRGNCSVTEQQVPNGPIVFGGSGSVIFSTLSSGGLSSISYGNGGSPQTFGVDQTIGFHDAFYQSGRGYKIGAVEFGGEQELFASLGGIVPNGFSWADTYGKYSEFRSPQINDSLNTAVIAELDAGGEEILAFLGNAALDPTVFSTYATTNGPFASFKNLSLGDGKNVAFLATLDEPGTGTAIYTGPDPVMDRLIGPGDKLFNKTVVSVDLAPADAVNKNGQIAFAVRFANNTSRIVKASPFTGAFVQASVALLSTLDQTVQPILWTPMAVPTEEFELTFNHKFLQQAGLLEVYLGTSLLGSFTSDTNGMASLWVDPKKIFASGIPDTAPLEFRLSGGPDISLHIDDVFGPGILNGDFEKGFLDEWRTIFGEPGDFDPRDPNDPGPHDPARAGIVTLVRTQPPPVPLPAGAWLLSGALAGMGFLRRNRG